MPSLLWIPWISWGWTPAPPLTYHCVSNWIFAMRHQEPELHYVLKPGIMGFGQAQVLGEMSWRMGRKCSGKNMPRNPLHNMLENLLNTWSVLTVFIGLILGTKKIKDRRTLSSLGNNYWGSADSAVFRTHWGVALARVPQLHLLLLSCSRGVWGNNKWDCKEIKILLDICPSSHRS